MRKLITGGLLLALAGASVAFSANHSVQIGGSSPHIMDTRYRVIPLSELTPDMVEDFFLGKKGPSFVLECTEESILPFRLSLNGDFLNLELEDTPSKIKVMKTCFINRVEDTFLFTTDFKAWKKFEEFFTGVVGISLNVEEGSPTVGFNLELNQRT